MNQDGEKVDANANQAIEEDNANANQAIKEVDANANQAIKISATSANDVKQSIRNKHLLSPNVPTQTVSEHDLTNLLIKKKNLEAKAAESIENQAPSDNVKQPIIIGPSSIVNPPSNRLLQSEFSSDIDFTGFIIKNEAEKAKINMEHDIKTAVDDIIFNLKNNVIEDLSTKYPQLSPEELTELVKEQMAIRTQQINSVINGNADIQLKKELENILAESEQFISEEDKLEIKRLEDKIVEIKSENTKKLDELDEAHSYSEIDPKIDARVKAHQHSRELKEQQELEMSNGEIVAKAIQTLASEGNPILFEPPSNNLQSRTLLPAHRQLDQANVGPSISKIAKDTLPSLLVKTEEPQVTTSLDLKGTPARLIQKTQALPSPDDIKSEIQQQSPEVAEFIRLQKLAAKKKTVDLQNQQTLESTNILAERVAPKSIENQDKTAKAKEINSIAGEQWANKAVQEAEAEQMLASESIENQAMTAEAKEINSIAGEQYANKAVQEAEVEQRLASESRKNQDETTKAHEDASVEYQNNAVQEAEVEQRLASESRENQANTAKAEQMSAYINAPKSDSSSPITNKLSKSQPEIGSKPVLENNDLYKAEDVEIVTQRAAEAVERIEAISNPNVDMNWEAIEVDLNEIQLDAFSSTYIDSLPNEELSYMNPFNYLDSFTNSRPLIQPSSTPFTSNVQQDNTAQAQYNTANLQYNGNNLLGTPPSFEELFPQPGSLTQDSYTQHSPTQDSFTQAKDNSFTNDSMPLVLNLLGVIGFMYAVSLFKNKELNVDDDNDDEPYKEEIIQKIPGKKHIWTPGSSEAESEAMAAHKTSLSSDAATKEMAAYKTSLSSGAESEAMVAHKTSLSSGAESEAMAAYKTSLSSGAESEAMAAHRTSLSSDPTEKKWIGSQIKLVSSQKEPIVLLDANTKKTSVRTPHIVVNTATQEQKAKEPRVPLRADGKTDIDTATPKANKGHIWSKEPRVLLDAKQMAADTSLKEIIPPKPVAMRIPNPQEREDLARILGPNYDKDYIPPPPPPQDVRDVRDVRDVDL